MVKEECLTEIASRKIPHPKLKPDLITVIQSPAAKLRPRTHVHRQKNNCQITTSYRTVRTKRTEPPSETKGTRRKKKKIFKRKKRYVRVRLHWTDRIIRMRYTHCIKSLLRTIDAALRTERTRTTDHFLRLYERVPP